MTEQDALLEAIFAAPAEDTPRLVYADWLDEHGEGVYAEFIRLQIARELATTKTAERDHLLKQEAAVWRKLKRKWTDLLPPNGLRKESFTRGFTNGCMEGLAIVSPEVFTAHSARWWPLLPIRRLSLGTEKQFPDELLECEHLRRLTRLHLQKVAPFEHTFTEEFTVRLFASEQFVRLTEFVVSRVALSRATADALRAAPFLNNLRRLGLGYYSLGHSGWLLLPTPDAYNSKDIPDVKHGEISRVLRERLDSLTGNHLIVQPGETSWRAMLEFTRTGWIS
ncbi:MAG: TIGR02996 domain-containing protein [Planctomycetes bacterium]|nr:TIGR02996 domain-containing protein [Planctomycetota bacterium]